MMKATKYDNLMREVRGYLNELLSEIDGIKTLLSEKNAILASALRGTRRFESNAPDEAELTVEDVRRCIASLRDVEIALFEDAFNTRMVWLAEFSEDESPEANAIKASLYTYKKTTARMVNELLREGGVAIQHPETGEPCFLMSVNSRDEEGRFTLESRVDKKRSGSFKTLLEILPAKLIPNLERKEGFLEARKKNTDGDG